ncbi:MAG: FkbM family methyltransferase [Ferruginibacter sp.]
MKKYRFKRLLKKLAGKYLIPHAQLNYAQFGEDLIINHFFTLRGIAAPSYLDIGANEPKFISNTFFFYEKGASGVLVEPNPILSAKLRKARPRDKVLNMGIGFEAEAEADFYVFPDYANGLSTFSKKEAEHWEKIGMKHLGKISVEKVIKVPLLPVNLILQENFPGTAPDFISLDVEGLDLDILKNMDFTLYRPWLICVETLKYDDCQNGYKDHTITEFMQSVNYSIYAETYVNTIYLKNDH